MGNISHHFSFGEKNNTSGFLHLCFHLLLPYVQETPARFSQEIFKCLKIRSSSLHTMETNLSEKRTLQDSIGWLTAVNRSQDDSDPSQD